MKSRKRLSASRNWCFIILDNDEEDIERLYCGEMYTFMTASIEPHGNFGSMISGFMQFEKKAGITKVQPCVGWKATLFLFGADNDGIGEELRIDVFFK